MSEKEAPVSTKTLLTTLEIATACVLLFGLVYWCAWQVKSYTREYGPLELIEKRLCVACERNYYDISYSHSNRCTPCQLSGY